MNVQFHKAAIEEAAAALAGYQTRSARAAYGFMRELNTLLAQIAHSPAIFARTGSDQRRAVFPHYPFSVIFTEHRNQVYVLAVAHAKLPGYWRKRQAPSASL